MLQEGTNITRIPPITFEACRKAWDEVA
jgi:hypothetical protein